MASSDEFQQRQYFDINSATKEFIESKFVPIFTPFLWRDVVKITGESKSEILWFETDGEKIWKYKEDKSIKNK